MKKNEWKTPVLTELKINKTEYNPNGGNTEDGAYTSKDGKYNFPTYGPSTGNSGTPGVDVN